MSVKRGDIYYIRDTRQSIGSEQRADRPADTFYYRICIKTVNRVMRTDKQRIRGQDRGVDRNADTGRNESIRSVFSDFHRFRDTTGSGETES